MLHCPSCQSIKIVKNGRIHNGEQNRKCRGCGRQSDLVFSPSRQCVLISLGLPMELFK